MLLEIVQYGNPVLKEKCRPVEHLDASLKDLANNMLETMYAAEEESVTWLKVDGEDKQLSDIMPLKFINPVLEPYGPMHPCHEGCLSVLKIRASVVRPDFVRATLTLLDGKRVTIDCNGLLARCLQHECDHLNGILFVERVSSAQKITLRNKLKRLAIGY